MYSYKCGEQLLAWKAANRWWYYPLGDDVTGLIVGTEYKAQTTGAGVPEMFMALDNPIAIHYAMFLNPFDMNAVKCVQIQKWWYEEIPWIDPFQRNSNPPSAYIPVVNESS